MCLFHCLYIIIYCVHTHTHSRWTDRGGSHLVKEFYFTLFYSPEVLQSTTAVSMLHTIQSLHPRSALWIWRSAVGTPWVPFLPEAPFQTRALHCCGCFLPRRYVHWVKAGSLDPAPVDSPGWKSCCWWATVPGPLPPGWCQSGLGDQSFTPGQTCPFCPHALIRGDKWPGEGPQGGPHMKDSSFLANFNQPAIERALVQRHSWFAQFC